MNDEFLLKVEEEKSNRNTFIVVTLVKIRGSAPQEVGARVLVDQSGLIWGTVGGGKVEERAIAHAKTLLTRDAKNDFTEWNLQTEIGMTCGGVVEFFFEKVSPNPLWEVAIFGAGHVAQELIRLLIKLDCHITCIDPRSEWLNKLPIDKKISKIQTEDMKSVLRNLPPKTFIASVTMGHAFDLPILKEALSEFDFPYVGVIGSEAKAKTLKNDLLNLGLTNKAISSLICPIGEKFGNNSPVEIAFSIVTQMIQKRDLVS